MNKGRNCHYDLLVQTPEPNLVEGMKWLQNTYTRRFNVRHRKWGRLFGDRYKSILVEGSGYYYESVMDYIHLNLKMKSAANVRQQVWRVKRGKSDLKKLSQEMNAWLKE